MTNLYFMNGLRLGGFVRARRPGAYSQTKKKLTEVAVYYFTVMNQGNGSSKSNERFLTKCSRYSAMKTR